MLRNGVMPASISEPMQSSVMQRYTTHIHLALVLRRGCSLVLIGPVASAANTFTLPPTNEGRRAMVKNTIPKPPIHCMNERQNNMPWGSVETSSMMEAPVVVKPDMVSKNASVNDCR